MATDPELTRLRQTEIRACALRDRLKSYPGLISDPKILQHAEHLCDEARRAIEAYLAARQQAAGKSAQDAQVGGPSKEPAQRPRDETLN